MGNQEQIQRLKRSIPAWNQWRRKHLDLRPDLSKADLREADLSSVDLQKADLSQADLRGLPWLFIMKLTLQPGSIWRDVRYDRMNDE